MFSKPNKGVKLQLRSFLAPANECSASGLLRFTSEKRIRYRLNGRFFEFQSQSRFFEKEKHLSRLRIQRQFFQGLAHRLSSLPTELDQTPPNYDRFLNTKLVCVKCSEVYPPSLPLMPLSILFHSKRVLLSDSFILFRFYFLSMYIWYYFCSII
jgi:hypothetical protein